MDRLKSTKGLLPGLFGKRNQNVDTRNGKDAEKASTYSSPLKSMPARFRNHFVAMAGEFVGTFMVSKPIQFPRPIHTLFSN
jgi:hypothetical protein